jgi:hypothetical protein
MTVYVIAQLKMTDRAAYARYQARLCHRTTSGLTPRAARIAQPMQGHLRGDGSPPQVRRQGSNKYIPQFKDELAAREPEGMDMN